MLTLDSAQDALVRIENYQRLIKLIRLKTIEEERCTLPHKVMANFLDVTADEITRWLDQLIRFRIIEKLGPGSAYRVMDLSTETTLLDQTVQLLTLIKEEPFFSFQQQAEALGINMNELEALFLFLIQFVS